MNRKLILNIFLNIFPIASAYGVFYILLSIIKQVPDVGQKVYEIWYIPFFIVTSYLIYLTTKDYKLSRQKGI
jgi:hypothetical protein